MRPLRNKRPKRQQIAEEFNLPAPTGGWYVGDNQASPPPKTAIVLNNAFPQLDYVRARRGSSGWATGLGAPVSTLMSWTNGVLSKMFGVAAGKIFDVSNIGAVGAAAVTGLGSSLLESVQFPGFGGTYLVAVNGVDSVQIFDGTGWNRTFAYTGNVASGSPTIGSISSIVGLQVGMALSGANIPAGTTIFSIIAGVVTMSANATGTATAEAITFYQNAPITGYAGVGFSFVWTYKGRLYFIDGLTLNVYYLGLAAIGGPATLLPLGPLFKLGGYLIAGSTWSIDSTSGIYEGCVFISSEGEVLLFNGDYPGATNWQELGLYKISKPLGRRCLMRAGGDLVIMTQDGIVPMSKVEVLDQIALENVALTKPIAPAWRNAVIARQSLLGWQITIWPLESMAIINLPKQNATDYTQYIANARTGAWAQYLGLDANCFCVFTDLLFYGDSVGNVWQGESGGSDAGVNPYTVTIMMGFSGLGAGSVGKQVLLVKPYVQASFVVAAKITINVDYDVTIPSAPSVSDSVTGALWDVALWDAAVWGGALINQNVWNDAQGYGAAIAPVYQLTINSGPIVPDVRIAAFDILFERGNILGASSGVAAQAPTNLSNNGGVLMTSLASFPSSNMGLPAGSVWSNGGVVMVVPTTTPDPAANSVFYSFLTALQLLHIGGANLPLSNPGAGLGILWINGDVVCIS